MLALVLPAAALAAEGDVDQTPAKRGDEGAVQAALPFTRLPMADESKGEVNIANLYDAARKQTLSSVRADVRLVGPLSLHGGAHTGMAMQLVSPLVGAGVRVLSQDSHFVDGAFSATYQGEGFNLVRALEMQASFGRRLGDSRVGLNLAYGHGLERGERYADLRLSAMHGLIEQRLYLGVDSRLRVDAERDDDEPAHEPEMDLLAGPIVGLTIGALAVAGFGGVSAVRYRDKSADRTGIFAGISIGSVLF